MKQELSVPRVEMVDTQIRDLLTGAAMEDQSMLPLSVHIFPHSSWASQSCPRENFGDC